MVTFVSYVSDNICCSGSGGLCCSWSTTEAGWSTTVAGWSTTEAGWSTTVAEDKTIRVSKLIFYV